jgi:electron transport complex protein RnfE
MVATNLMVSLSRRWIHQDLRLPAYVLLIATFVTVVELVFRAWGFELHLRLGIFLPLIVTNCAILARAEVFASRSTAPAAVRDGLVYGAGFMIALLSVGALRELLAYGSLFSDMQILLGDIGGWRGLQLTDARDGFLLAALPPGAFIALGMLVALHRRLTGSGENK